MTLGELIRTERLKRKWTQPHLAKQSGVSESYISKLENDGPTNPDKEAVKKVAAGLGINENVLLELAGYSVPKEDERPLQMTLLCDKAGRLSQRDFEIVDGLIDKLLEAE